MKLEEMRALMEKGEFSTDTEQAPPIIKVAKEARRAEVIRENTTTMLAATEKKSALLRETGLNFKSGKSDKVYIIRLLRMDDGSYAVKAKWGRRGSNLRNAIKFTGSKEDAKMVYGKLQREKMLKGYTVTTNRNLEE